MIIRHNQDARDALIAAAKMASLSVTALTEKAGIGMGTLTRFAFQKTRQRKVGAPGERPEPELWVSTWLKALDTAGYEVVVRRKVSGSRREQRLQVLKAKGADDVGEGAA